MSKKKLIIIGTVLAAVVGAGAIGTTALKSKAKTQTDGVPKGAVAVEAEKAHIETIVSTVKADGYVEFSDSSVVYGSNSAEIKKVYVEEGDYIEAGQILVEYDRDSLDELKNQLSDAQLSLKAAKVNLEKAQLPAEESELKQYETQITQSENSIKESEYRIEQYNISLEQAENNLSSAQRDYDNAKTLYSNGVITKNELDEKSDKLEETKNNLKTVKSQLESEQLSIETSKSSLELAKTQYDSLNNKLNLAATKKEIEGERVQVQQAEQKIKQINDEISKFKINEAAPVSGTIVKLDAKEGENSASGKLLFEIADMNNLIIKAEVSEYDMSEIQIGQEAEITGDAIAESFKGKITKIYPIAEEKKQSSTNKTIVNVEITPDTTQMLKSGYTVDAEIKTKVSENAVVVPIMAYITESDGSTCVYVIKDDFSVEKRTVKRKAYSDLYVEVEGVSVGENVISSPDYTIQEGMFVRPSNLETEVSSSESTSEASDKEA